MISSGDDSGVPNFPGWRQKGCRGREHRKDEGCVVMTLIDTGNLTPKKLGPWFELSSTHECHGPLITGLPEVICK